VHFAGKPTKIIPILQWLVVLVLMSHPLIDGGSSLEPVETAELLVGLIVGNLVLLYAAPRFLKPSGVVATLVVVDTLLVPFTLYLTGTGDADLFVVYFGIIMIAAVSGKLGHVLLLTTFTALGYATFTLLQHPNAASLESMLVRLPFLLVMTLLYGSLAEHARKEQETKGKLEHDALHDELTGLGNRRLLQMDLARSLAEAERFKGPLSCIVLDVDGFKQVNDTHGHDMGDKVLWDIGSLIIKNSRAYDVAARLGGDEYAWVLPREDREGALTAAERLRSAVERHRFGGSTADFHLTVSVGVTTFVPGTAKQPTPALVLKAADEALYKAKREGKNQIHHLLLEETGQTTAVRRALVHQGASLVQRASSADSSRV
jgi:diguanylate cyclase (GGDEF)-like protein